MKVDATKYDGTTIRDVLQWSSENLELVRPNQTDRKEGWECYSKGFWYVGSDLYECFYSAWVQNTGDTP